MTVQLNQWHETYAKQGLAIVEVDLGIEDDGGDEPEDLKEHIEESEIKYPILHDPEGKNFAKYEVATVPAAYLLAPDEKGELKVVWNGRPNPIVADLEKLIKEQLEKLPKPVEKKSEAKAETPAEKTEK